MKITTYAKQIRITDDLKNLFEVKLSKLDKFFKDDATASIKLRERNNGRKIVEITVTTQGFLFRAESEDETFRSALDDATAALERQIRKNKTKLAKRIKENAFLKDAFDELDEVEESEPEIRVKTFSFKPMTPEEAILQMELLGHEFFIFENSEIGKVSVIYKRHGTKYGMIVQE